eukprot:comp20075_c1_seq1/m.24707 comp20075_c1_seq1/g.24707  ORF comp20075_c1_seq1/g.24707 comp20075_c1_seq1/m.24707 type:complete len:395 (-) comp20075_c1_seq1:154-1338(-)
MRALCARFTLLLLLYQSLCMSLCLPFPCRRGGLVRVKRQAGGNVTSSEGGSVESSSGASDDGMNVFENIGLCGSDQVDVPENLLVDGGFECLSGGPKFNGTRWSLPVNATPVEDAVFGYSALQVLFVPGLSLAVEQTIILPADSTSALVVRAFGRFDDINLPYKGMRDEDHGIRVTFMDTNGIRTNPVEVVPFSPERPGWYTATAKEITPKAPYRRIRVNLFYRNTRAQVPPGVLSYIYYDSVLVKFKDAEPRPTPTQDDPDATPTSGVDYNTVAPTPTTTPSTQAGGSNRGTSFILGVSLGCLAFLTFAAIGFFIYRRYRKGAKSDVPSMVGPDYVPYKPRNLKDKLFDRRSLYSVGTTLSERMRQWRYNLNIAERERHVSEERSNIPVDTRS